jgi:intracellular sulfur oxidation DsrE/DsrF family protein
MTVNKRFRYLVVIPMLFALSATAQDDLPWGTATVQDKSYRPAKVVYDLSSGNAAVLTNILDRASMLSAVYEADPFAGSIIVVVHGDAIPLFTQKAYEQTREVMARAQSLTVGNIVEFRMCRASARVQGVEPRDVHGFITMVPMADAEIVELQEQGYAYMR